MEKLPRKPKVKNKYNLTPVKIKKLRYDRKRISEKPFWRNDVIGAWCICCSTMNLSDPYSEYAPYDSFWLGIYDEDAKSYAGKLRIEFTSCGDMCNYNFKQFYTPSDIDNEDDLRIQEMCLEIINDLIDKQILLLN